MNKREKVLYTIIRVAAFIAVSLLAVQAGVIAGNAISTVDAKLIENVDVVTFKSALNASLPIIDTTYNSGRVNVSYGSELKRLVNSIFGFDMDTPATILNAASPWLDSYYSGAYLAMKAEQDRTAGQGEIAYWEMYGDIYSDNVSRGDSRADGYLTDYSSISTEDEDRENRDYSRDNITPVGKIEIRNNTSKVISDSLIKTLLNEPLKFSFDKNGPKVLIYHTHTTEAYLKNLSELGRNVPNWTLDERYSVVRVGDELANQLSRVFGIDVIHNGTIHNYPNTTGFYTRSRETVQRILKGNPSIRLLIDLHRDGVSGSKLRVTRNIGGKTVAQIMFVVGTANPSWRENFKLALKLQNKLNEIAPGIARPIYLDNYTYNQDLGYGALIVEMGGDGNVITEAVESAKYLAQAISEVMR